MKSHRSWLALVVVMWFAMLAVGCQLQEPPPQITATAMPFGSVPPMEPVTRSSVTRGSAVSSPMPTETTVVLETLPPTAAPPSATSIPSPTGVPPTPTPIPPTSTPEPSPTEPPSPTPPIATATVAPTATVPPTSAWAYQFFDSNNLTGNVLLSGSVEAISYDWGSAHPAELNPNVALFSARWTRQLVLPAGTYRFAVRTTDGIRVRFGDFIIIDHWENRGDRGFHTELGVQEGSYLVTVEFRERGGSSDLHFWWEESVIIDSSTGEEIDGWRGRYWNNMSLDGAPALQRIDNVIDFDWGSGSPENVSNDEFSANWTLTVELEGGLYRFDAVADNGLRFAVDGKRLIDAWINETRQTLTAEMWLPPGVHQFDVDYFEGQGFAEVAFNYALVDRGEQRWRGNYFDNPTLQGGALFTTADDTLSFQWPSGGPAPAPAEQYSVRWEQWVDIPIGSYRFTAEADTGVRVYVDGRLIIDDWDANRSPGPTTVEITLSGTTRITVEFYELTGGAFINVAYARTD